MHVLANLITCIEKWQEIMLEDTEKNEVGGGG